jgi:hypothetical protein
MARGIGGEGGAVGGRDPNAGGKAGRNSDRGQDRIDNIDAGYTTGNPFPGYRGPAGTRSPNTNPQKAPGNAGFSPGAKAKPSIWDRVFTPRRTTNVTPSYKPTVSNLSKVLSRVMPGPGLVAGAVQDIAGTRAGFKDFTGNVKGPGDWDPKDHNTGILGATTQAIRPISKPRVVYTQGAVTPYY